MSKASMKSLLIELGTEELPPKALRKLAQSFANSITEELLKDGFVKQSKVDSKWYATPRRLAVWVGKVADRQPDQQIERKGPAVKAAFDADGNPTKACEGFARSCGVAVAELSRIQTEKGEWLVHRSRAQGETLDDKIQSILELAVKQLPIPKRMRWGSGDAEFVRPAHWLVALHGARVLPAKILGIVAGQESRGHRFMGAARIRITSADKYATLLKDKGCVWVDYEERKLEIHIQAEEVAKRFNGQPIIDDSLLEEVTGLVEWPRAIAGSFDKRFLDVPQQALVSSMRDHQKYFHVEDGNGNLLPHFITISNIISQNPERVRKGNERVLRARLADAEFFWAEDKKRSLDSRFEELAGVMFHKKLGSVKDKSERIAQLAGKMARQIGENVEPVVRVARLCKIDLVTNMVGEFPELQGTMGRYYAQHDGEPSEVALAIEEHYMPRQAGDQLPTNNQGRLVAIADKVDTLTGIFASGEVPSGDKDPYGLRRISLGLIRILIEGELDLNIADLINYSAGYYKESRIDVSDEACEKARSFVIDRYPAYYSATGYQPDEIAAVKAVHPERPLDFDKRLRAIQHFKSQPAAASLAAANKRIRNILKKSPDEVPHKFNADVFEEEAETNLVRMLVQISSRVSPLVQRGDYQEALQILSEFREPVDQFFDEVMVMDKDPILRNNRLALLNQLSGLFMGIADISRLKSSDV
ncbi:MAG: glycyl-tRNA synthetase beta chain [Parasphingorhabdus sp.]|jgi:glycyl-tRNA synthetase beta chain